MKNLYKYGAAFIFFFALAVIVFRCSLGAENAYSASDANIGLLTASRPAMSELFSPGYGGFILGGVRPPRFSPYSFLHALLSPALFNDLIAPLYLMMSSLLLLIFLRMWERSWMASVLGALAAFWLGSSTVAASGHYGKLGVALFFVASLVLVEKSVRSVGLRRLCWSVLAGASVGFMLLSQQDVGLLFGLLLAPYALLRLVQLSRRKPVDWIITLLPIALIGILLSAGKAVSSYSTSVTQASAVQESNENKWDFITQWSYPPKEFPDLLAPGFMGWKTNDPKAPYWGVAGQSADWTAKGGSGYRNFRLDSVYLGFISVLLSIAALMSAFGKKDGGQDGASRIVLIFWGIAAFAMFILACGKFTPLYRLVVQLPLIGDIRAPVKFLQSLAVVLGILSAFGLDAVLSSKKICKKTVVTTVILGGLFLLTALVLLVAGSSIAGQLSAWGESAPLIAARMRISSFYSAAAAVLVFLLLKYATTASRAKLFGAALCMLLAVDSIYVTSHYFRADNIGVMKRGNPVISYLKANQGRQRVFTFDRGGIYNQWIGVDFPLHGINGFWFWQAPRLSQDYKNYLAHGGKNVVALLQSTSVKYALAPAGAVSQLPRDVFKPVMFYRFGMDQNKNLVVQPLAAPQDARDQVLLELTQTLPRVSLFYGWKQVAAEKMNEELFSTKNKLMQKVLVDAELPSSQETGFEHVQSIVKKHNSVTIQANAKQDAVLLFTQRYQPQWIAYIDGKQAPIFRCNSLSMGVHIPAGSHEIVFKCTGYTLGSILQLIGLVLTLAAIVILAVNRKKVVAS